MQLGKVQRLNGENTVVYIEGTTLFTLDMKRKPGIASLADILHSPDPARTARELIDPNTTTERLVDQMLLAPIDRQEVWAAGVTYKRSKVAREEESKGASQFYDKVYTADRPELFMKSTPERVVGPGQHIRVRGDAKWSVPEPELALVISPALKIVGFTVGNDVSSRDIEGENPLYLPQAKVYRGSCAVGPLITLASAMPALPGVEIRLVINRGSQVAFQGTTTLAQMARTPESLVEWLGREYDFPNGAILLTGTGIVPPDDFNLTHGDDVAISITGIGTLSNPVQ